MSIYPVPLMEWFPHPRHNLYEDYWESKNMHETAKWLVQNSKCHKCGKSCKWNRAWGHHSIPWGYGEVWCTKECLYSKKKIKKKRERISKKWKKFYSWEKNS